MAQARAPLCLTEMTASGVWRIQRPNCPGLHACRAWANLAIAEAARARCGGRVRVRLRATRTWDR